MGAQLQFCTSGNMTIELKGLRFGIHHVDPNYNVKHYSTNPSRIELHAMNQMQSTNIGIIEIHDLNPLQNGIITVTIDSPTIMYYGTAQFSLIVQGQNILTDNFQSGVKGPLGDPKIIKNYQVGFIG